MAPERPPGPTPTQDTAYLRGLFLSFAAVAVCFVLSTVYAQSRTLAMDHEIASLIHNGLPSIDELSSVNDALRRIEVAADELGDAPTAHRLAIRDGILRERRTLDAHLATYLAMPMFPGERERYADVKSALEDVDASLGRLFAAMGDETGALAHLADLDVRITVARASATLRDLLALNIAGSRSATARIVEVRDGATRVALMLDAFSVALAVVAAFVARNAFQRYAELAEQNRALLARRAEDLERFAQHVAHDLVSPLSALSVRLDRIQRRGVDVPGIDESVRQAKACVVRATRMTRGIFEFARGATTSDAGLADVAVTLAGVADDVRASADPQEPHIVVTAAPDLVARCAPGVLTSVVTNLIDNAVKHGQTDGHADVAVRATAEGDLVRIEVEDHGPGLPPGAELSVFEPYARVPGTTAPGLGIGLATVKRLVEGHGGKVHVVSRHGAGCTFHVELPRADAPHA